MSHSVGGRLRLAWITLLLALTGTASIQTIAQDAALSEKEKSRLRRLDQMADAIQAVKVDMKRSTGDRVVDGRRYSDSSQLHMRFLTAVADLTENKKDGICMFPVQVSGFSSQIHSARGMNADRKTGSDMQRAEITLTGLIGQPRPKAKIKLAALDHGSGFPADQIARDRIHDLIRLYFPEAEIDGMQRLFEKELEIRNSTDESIRVWVYGRSWNKSPEENEGQELGRTDEEVRNEGGEVAWRWLPGEPGRAKPIELTIAAGKSQKVVFGDGPLAANRVLLWAESESGERWWDHKKDPLWLVEPNKKQNDERTYHAEKIATYTHTIKSKPSPRLLTERLLEMKNATSDPLEIKLQYRANSGNGFAWRSTRFTIGPKETARPVDSAGSRIRASRVKFAAKSENRQYTSHEEQPLWLVEESNGRRAYKADKIGVFAYTFEPAAQSTNDAATVNVAQAPIMSGNETLGMARQDQKLKTLETKGNWVQVEFQQAGEKKVGWIQKQNLKAGGTTLQSAPQQAKKQLQVTANKADFKLAADTIAQLNRGQSFEVLEQNGDWLQIEAVVEGVPRIGWVHSSNVSVK